MARKMTNGAKVLATSTCFQVTEVSKGADGRVTETKDAVEAYEIALDYAKGKGRNVAVSAKANALFERCGCSIAHEFTVVE